MFVIFKIWLCTVVTKVYCHFNAFLRHKSSIILLNASSLCLNISNFKCYCDRPIQMLLCSKLSNKQLKPSKVHGTIDCIGLYESYRRAFWAMVLYQSGSSAPTGPAPSPVCIRPNSNQSVPIVYTLVWISHNECRRSFLLFLRMLCHLLIAKRTIEHIRRGKSYFKLFFGFFCYIYFLVLDLLCRRESTDVFFISARNLFSSFLYNLDVFGEILKSNIWYRCVLWRTCMLFVLP